MKPTPLFLFALGRLAALAVIAGAAGPSAKSGDNEAWSEPTNGLQARITLVEKPRINGTRQLVPYLELKNLRDSASPLKVRCSGENVKFELVDQDGTPVRDGQLLERSGPHADPGTVALPFDSSIRIGMYCSNWGVPTGPATMISTDSGAWVLRKNDKGKVFLRATLKGAKPAKDSSETWHGEVIAPLVRVDWNESP